MIENFKDMEMRKSGVVYSSTLEQIKKLYAVDPEKAGEFAISAIELVLCGGISSTDMMIELMLEPAKTMVERDKDKYDMKVQTAKEKKMYEQKLDRIAELHKQGLKQRDIGERLGLSQQIVSYRMSVIKTEYPELLATSEQGEAQDIETLPANFVF